MDSKKLKFQTHKTKITAHKKEVPAAAMAIRRSGKLKLQYIETRSKRQHARHVRKKGLFKKAVEYATLTGDDVEVRIKDTVFSASEEGLVRDDVTGELLSNKRQEESNSAESVVATCSNVLLSPRALRGGSSKIQTCDIAVQVSMLEAWAPIFGNERHCRICGKKFDDDSRSEQLKWIGCNVDTCDYWLHCHCLLGKSSKINHRFCKALPYVCPRHRN